MDWGRALMAIGTGVGEGYIGTELEKRKRELEERELQNRLTMGLAPYIRDSQFNPMELQQIAPNNPSLQGMLGKITPKAKPFDIDEVTRLGKAMEMYDPQTKGWRTPDLTEIIPIVKDPESAISSGRFRFREPTSLLKTPSGKDPGVWREAINKASAIVMNDFSLMGSPYEEKARIIAETAEGLYPSFLELQKGKVPKKKKTLGPPTPNQ